MSNVISAVKEFTFVEWAIVAAVIAMIAAVFVPTLSEMEKRKDPNYDPCAKFVDMPSSAANCYEGLIRLKESKAKYESIKRETYGR